MSIISSLGFAQSTTEQEEVVVQETPALTTPSEIVMPTAQESFLTRYLRFFVRGFDVTEIVEEEMPYEPITAGAEDSVFQERLNQIHTLMDLPYNPRVRAYIESYIVRRRNQMRAMLMLSRYYFPMFEKELEKHGMPDELKYLAVIESALNPRAVSRAGASGPWQFMYRTGRMFGLRVTPELDERFDPEKSTEAAVLYLKSLHSQFDCWTLALAAYNSGPGTVRRAITRARGKRDFWEIYQFLPRETRNYVPGFIGATYAFTYYREHGITLSETDWPEIMDSVVIHQRLHFDQIAQFTGTPMQTIRDHNPQYLKDVVPASEENPFVLRLPANFILKFIEYSDTIFMAPLSEQETQQPALTATGEQSTRGQLSRVTYRVKRGDALSLIAVRFGVTVPQLKEWNNLQSDFLRVNQNLTIYTNRTNLRDMTEVVAVQNAERERAAAVAAANPPPAQQTQTQQPARPATTTTTQNRPATTSTSTTQQQRATTTPATTETSTPTTVLPRTPTGQNQAQTRPTNTATTSARTVPTQPTPITPNQQAAQRTQSNVPLRSATGNMQSSNVTVVPSRNRAATTGKIVHHSVQRGETLFSIQRKHPGSSIQDIINMNGLRDNGNKIYPGQTLKIRVN
ncbi:MAG: transglycosylase SLT domain-containing protein [Bacteroidales bacterium]|nr:transglycosylase SLT domain-containing protein [Bacteroidales bacterium]